MSIPSALLWEGGELRLLDQRQLPHRVEYLRIDGIPAAVDAIATLAVRGAPAIGIAAAYALTVAARRSGDVAEVLKDGGDALIAARPTAVNLRWAVERMRGR
ncbi:MAG: S-methyl-5-thioribose-1-phosphate isomerase, partial [Gammaproteobacteria bacterium]|nr:S-methyl-5-thioribose-1-phosphate isomerase [Gammaproteobacteria bacterium]